MMGTRTRGYDHARGDAVEEPIIGNPLSTGLLNRLFRSEVSDAHCGMRAFTKDAYRSMDLHTTGMWFASEMRIRAAMAGMTITEVPIRFLPDGRGRKPHLRPWRDGWRHLKTILLFSPSALFLVPGLILLEVGLLLMAMQLFAPMEQPLRVFGFRMDFHWAMLRLAPGYRRISDCARELLREAVRHGARDPGGRPLLPTCVPIAHARASLVIGAVVVLIGMALDGFVAFRWLRTDLGVLVSGYTRVFIFGSTLVALGVQTIFSAFFLSILRDDY